ncbi:MAG: phosphoribosylformylglycinamidine cyclo-ligase [Candidatus Bathyarchaeia archaeon]
MPREFTYADAGVNRKVRAESKKALSLLKETYKFCPAGNVVQLPYGNIFPVGKSHFLDLTIEGVGTKVLLAQLAEKYDTIGIDGVAMAVNDVIRSGAKPLAVADNIHAQFSEPKLIRELMKGISAGAVEAECVVPSGEIGDVSEVIQGLREGKGFDLVVAAIGSVSENRVITGRDIKAGDAIIGLRSTGLHSNGISLARRILFKQWNGKYEAHDIPDGLEIEIVYEVLKPTQIYAKPFLKLADRVPLKAAVHITGEGYAKFRNLAKFSKNIGFVFNNFKPQPIFELIQQTATELGGRISDEEMFRTFNMGWGFAVIVDKANVDDALDALGKSGIHAELIGEVKSLDGTVVYYKKRKIVLK